MLKQSDIKTKKINNSILNMKDLTFSTKDELIFLTGFFQSGNVMGFWTHSPWGRCYDMEQGWALIDTKEMKIIDQCTSKEGGLCTGNVREWRTKIKLEHGSSKKLLNEYGELDWKITGN